MNFFQKKHKIIILHVITEVSQAPFMLFSGSLLLIEGDSASSYRHWRNGASHTGSKGEKEGRRR